MRDHKRHASDRESFGRNGNFSWKDYKGMPVVPVVPHGSLNYPLFRVIAAVLVVDAVLIAAVAWALGWL